jgi:hypothetical protein
LQFPYQTALALPTHERLVSAIACQEHLVPYVFFAYPLLQLLDFIFLLVKLGRACNRFFVSKNLSP